MPEQEKKHFEHKEKFCYENEGWKLKKISVGLVKGTMKNWGTEAKELLEL